MKKLKVLLSVLLVVCMVVGFAPLHATASAAKEDWEWYWSEEYRNRGHWTGWSYHDGWYELSDKWYQVDFSPVTVPVQVNTPGTSSNGTATAAGSTVQMVGTSFSYFYNEWAGTLIIRGTGEMPSFSKEYPAPWANLKDKAARVIIERNITKISSNAFVDFSRLRSVVLPATLKAIDPDAFVWSDATRAKSSFRPLERLEFSGDLDTLDRILKAANIPDLLDARIVKVTEKAIQDEIWQLTWYRIRKPVRVKYDRAGRPILVERVDENGTYFRTSITWDDTLADGNVHSFSQPTSPDTAKSGKDFTRDVIEKRETLSVNPDGVENLYEFEKNDLGQTTYFAAFHLENGVAVGGRQIFSDETGVTKAGIMTSVTKVGEDTYREWENVLASDSSIEHMLEILDKFGRVKSITTDKGDAIENTYASNGLLTKRVVVDSGQKTEYTYNYTGNILQSVSADNGNTTTYTYHDNGSMEAKVQTQGASSVTTLYTLYNRASSELIREDGKIKYVYLYEYDSNGVVTKRTIQDKDGNVIGTDTFNSAGVLIQSQRSTSTPITVKSAVPKTTKKLSAPRMAKALPEEGLDETLETETLDTETLETETLETETLDIESELNVDAGKPMMARMMTTMVTTTFDPETGSKTSETVETDDGITKSLTSYNFNSLGLLTNVSSSFTDEEGKTSDFSLKSTYDVDGNIVGQTEETSDFDNNSKVSKYIFGKLSKPLSLDVTESGEDGTPTNRSFSTFLYHGDGSFTETVTEMDNDGTIAASYIINHDAPVDDDADVVDEDEEDVTDEDEALTDEDEALTDEDEALTDEDEALTDEDEALTDEDEALTDEDEDVTDEDENTEEIEPSKVPLAAAPAAEDDEDDEKDDDANKAEIVVEGSDDDDANITEGENEDANITEGEGEDDDANITEGEDEDEDANITEGEGEDEDANITEGEDEEEAPKAEDVKEEAPKAEDVKKDETPKAEDVKDETPKAETTNDESAAEKAAEEEAAAEKAAAQAAAEEEAKRKAAEEEAKRKAAEEEAKRKAAEEEAKRKAAEEAARKAAEEAAAQAAAEAAAQAAAAQAAAEAAAQAAAAQAAAEAAAQAAAAQAAAEAAAQAAAAQAAAEAAAAQAAAEAA